MNNQLIERNLLQSIKKAFRYFSVLTWFFPNFVESLFLSRYTTTEK